MVLPVAQCRKFCRTQCHQLFIARIINPRLHIGSYRHTNILAIVIRNCVSWSKHFFIISWHSTLKMAAYTLRSTRDSGNSEQLGLQQFRRASVHSWASQNSAGLVYSPLPTLGME